MKIRVDLSLCSGHARCAAVAPDVYQLDDNGYCTSNNHTVPAHLQNTAKRGAKACPERAITLDVDTE